MAMDQVSFQKPDTDVSARLPVQPLGWRILVRPYTPPRTSEGGIEYVDETLQNEAILTNVGQVVAMGSHCYKAVTRSGIEMSKVEPKPKVGDWVMYGTYGGQKFNTREGVMYTMINDDSIMGIVDDPTNIRNYI